MSDSKTCNTCDNADCSAKQRQSGETDEAFRERQQLENRLCGVAHKIFVLSGKGGVGKSTVAANLAVALSQQNKRVGLLDIDIHGPSIPKMLGLANNELQAEKDAIIPVKLGQLKVMSIGFLLSHPDQAVIWRGPMKMGVIKQFLKDVVWGDLDYLVIDCPPGTGDEPLSIAQLVPHPDGAIIVTTPQEVAIVDVRKCVNFCRQLKLPVLGVVENMSGFICPKCGERLDVFKSGGGEDMARDMGVPFLNRIPIDPAVASSGDAGQPCVNDADSPSAKAFIQIANTLTEQLEGTVSHAS